MNNIEARKTLLRRQQELSVRLATLDEHLRRKGTTGESGQTQVSDSDDMLEKLAVYTAKELLHVKHVLKKLGGRAQGICINCGNKIGHQRLRAVPDADLCLHCVNGTH